MYMDAAAVVVSGRVLSFSGSQTPTVDLQGNTLRSEELVLEEIALVKRRNCFHYITERGT